MNVSNCKLASCCSCTYVVPVCKYTHFFDSAMIICRFDGEILSAGAGCLFRPKKSKGQPTGFRSLLRRLFAHRWQAVLISFLYREYKNDIRTELKRSAKRRCRCPVGAGRPLSGFGPEEPSKLVFCLQDKGVFINELCLFDSHNPVMGNFFRWRGKKFFSCR